MYVFLQRLFYALEKQRYVLESVQRIIVFVDSCAKYWPFQKKTFVVDFLSLRTRHGELFRLSDDNK